MALAKNMKEALRAYGLAANPATAERIVARLNAAADRLEHEWGWDWVDGDGSKRHVHTPSAAILLSSDDKDDSTWLAARYFELHGAAHYERLVARRGPDNSGLIAARLLRGLHFDVEARVAEARR